MFIAAEYNKVLPFNSVDLGEKYCPTCTYEELVGKDNVIVFVGIVWLIIGFSFFTVNYELTNLLFLYKLSSP